MWLEITLTLSQHGTQNEPIKQMAPDPSLAAAEEDINKRKAFVSGYTHHHNGRAWAKGKTTSNKHKKENTQVDE